MALFLTSSNFQFIYFKITIHKIGVGHMPLLWKVRLVQVFEQSGHENSLSHQGII